MPVPGQAVGKKPNSKPEGPLAPTRPQAAVGQTYRVQAQGLSGASGTTTCGARSSAEKSEIVPTAVIDDFVDLNVTTESADDEGDPTDQAMPHPRPKPGRAVRNVHGIACGTGRKNEGSDETERNCEMGF